MGRVKVPIQVPFEGGPQKFMTFLSLELTQMLQSFWFFGGHEIDQQFWSMCLQILIHGFHGLA